MTIQPPTAPEAVVGKAGTPLRLTFRQRADWVAHVLKAGLQQHHQHLKPVFRPYIPEDGVIIDIGAHAGQFSRLFAAMAPRGHVWALEPSPYAHSVMNAASRFRRIRNISLVPAGLSDQAGELVLHTPVKRAGGLGFGAAHLGADDGSRPTVAQDVRLTTLDSLVTSKGIERIDFIKADIEGWELHALKGGEASLLKFRPALYLEVSDAHLSRAGGSAHELFEWLQARGYAAISPKDGRAVDAYVAPGNFLFLPSGRPAAS